MDTISTNMSVQPPKTSDESLKRTLARIAFLPTLSYQMLTRVFGREWRNQVDEHVWMGALPTNANVQDLYDDGVRGVINLCEEYAGPQRAYHKRQMSQLHLPTIDFQPPSLTQVQQALAFIDTQIQQGYQTYIHCKAGRGRSATVVLCYLLNQTSMSPQEAQEHLQRIRPRVIQDLWRRDVVQSFEALQKESQT
ncbi:MAG TPA: phosphatase [Myxococcales bacterium]|nr:phosphatase [Deltaproteobacteria bacterium]HAA57410.1 phosphatase [Myxococcales bacterium]|tara:strand:+ start:1868 stop:2449 length:582 start_codon:yes stop_codon:yes gene_type:complete